MVPTVFKAFRRILGKSSDERGLPPVRPADVAADPRLTFGFSTRPETDGTWTVSAYGPSGGQCGRVLMHVNNEQMATLTLGGAQADTLDKQLALAGAWEEACANNADNDAIIEHFANEMTRINGVDPRL